MATTALEVFNITMGLIDALVNGQADNSDTAGYKARMVTVINNALPELYMFSDTRTDTAGKRSVPASITTIDDELPIDDGLARAVLPHAVAAALLAIDDAALANYHEQKYMEKLARFIAFALDSEEIEDVYYTSGLYNTSE